jgi:hypothetical protein
MRIGIFFVLGLMLLACLPLGAADEQPYDVILVRNDIPIEYIIALPYATMNQIPVMQVSQEALTPQEEKQLSGYYQEGARRALILGGVQNAISQEIEETIRDIGYDVDRKWGLARESTAGIFAVDLWETSPVAVLLNGSVPEAYLVGAKTAMTLSCPILLIDDSGINDDTIQALQELSCTEAYIVGPSISEVVLSTLDGMGVSYTLIGTDINPHDVEPAEKGGVSLSPASLLAGMCIGIVAMYAILGTRRQQQPMQREISVPLFVLTDDERKVVEAIEGVGGELRQDALPDLTSFSRPKVSRIISDLEGKKIIAREKKGKTYKVIIAKKFIIEDENAPST